MNFISVRTLDPQPVHATMDVDRACASVSPCERSPFGGTVASVVRDVVLCQMDDGRTDDGGSFVEQEQCDSSDGQTK